jgi:hypothetical protein
LRFSTANEYDLALESVQGFFGACCDIFYYVYLYVLVLAISIFETHMFRYTTPNTTPFALLVLQMKDKHHTQAAISLLNQTATYKELTKAVGLVGAS